MSKTPPKTAPTTDAAKPTTTPQKTSPRVGDGRAALLIGAVVAIFVAALAGSGFLGWQLWQERQVDAGRLSKPSKPPSRTRRC